MNIELALEEHLPKEIAALDEDIQRTEQQLAEKYVRMAKLHRIAGAAGVIIEPDTAYRDTPPLDLVA